MGRVGSRRFRFPMVGVVTWVIAVVWVRDVIGDEAIRVCRVVEERGLAPRAEVGG